MTPDFLLITLTGDSDETDDEDDILLAQLARFGVHPDLDNMAEIENDMETEETHDGEWEQRLINEHRQELTDKTNDESDVEGDETADDNISTDLTYTSVLASLNELRKFAILNDDRYLGPIQNLIDMTQTTILRRQTNSQQTTLDSYFKK